MNVNIVCVDLAEDKVLPRLAKSLAAGTGWTLSEKPNPRADLNYFQIYITQAERHSDFRATPTAAYFSHYEPDSPYKAQWWADAMQDVGGCILTARQYGAMLPTNKPRWLARPPVDAELFALREPRASPLSLSKGRPRVGVSGFVDKRSARKGDALVKQLAARLGDRYDFVACGAGWSVPTRQYAYSDLPEFYHSLDLLLCASSIEGIPMPPLEALACGVPVVVPDGVGLLDELPTMAGIERYTIGNVNAAADAIERALSAPYAPDALRSVITSQYTAAHWCRDHETAFAELLGKQAAGSAKATKSIGAHKLESDRHGQRGVYYVAYGGPARNCAKAAIASFKQYMPDIPVALVSDRPLGGEDVFIQHADEDIGGRSAKVKIDALAPKEWQYIAYLDADTEIVSASYLLYELLEDGFDFVICKNPGRYSTTRAMVRSDNKDECESTFGKIGTDELIQLNGGVFAYQRNERTRAFFAAWHEEWMKWAKRDQAALLRALFAHPLRTYVLGNEWNTITRYDSPDRAAWLLHYPMTARRWRGVIHHPLTSPEAWREVEMFEKQGAK